MDAQINQLIAELQEERQRRAGLEEQLNHIQARMQGARAPRPPNVHIRPFRAVSDQEFYRWQRHLTCTAQLNRWEDGDTLLAALGAMEGHAADMTQNLSPALEAYAGLDGFLSTLRGIFITPVYKDLAKAEFGKRIQGKGEDIKVFHSLLAALWKDAYQDEEEPWRGNAGLAVPAGQNRQEAPGFRNRRLMDQFLAGLRDFSLRTDVRNSMVINQIDDYQTLLERCLAFYANRERSHMDERRIRFGTSATPYSPQQMGMQHVVKGRMGGPEPMDIGAIPRQKPGSPDEACAIHKGATHTNTQCRNQKGTPRPQGASYNAPQRRQFNPPPRQPETGFRTVTPRDGRGYERNGRKNEPQGQTCYHCHKPGHWRYQCPERPKVHYVEPEEDPVSREPYDENQPEWSDEEFRPTEAKN